MQTILERELIKKAQLGDNEAENMLVLEYENYVRVLSRPYFLAGAEKEDVIQIGSIGLIRAIRTFDEKNQNNFKTYATRCIRNAILDGIRESNAKKNIPLNTSCSFEKATSEDEDVTLFGFFQSDELDPEMQYIEKEAREAFFDALSQTLGEKDLSIIKLYLSSMPYKEISEELGITQKKVDNTIYNAKKKIEKIMKTYNKE